MPDKRLGISNPGEYYMNLNIFNLRFSSFSSLRYVWKSEKNMLSHIVLTISVPFLRAKMTGNEIILAIILRVQRRKR